MDKDIEELESRIIERVKFWDGMINLMIRLRESGIYATSPLANHRYESAEREFEEGMQRAINAALLLQQHELAECLMLAGIGGERANRYAKERAEKILGDKIEYASKMGYVPTFWAE